MEKKFLESFDGTKIYYNIHRGKKHFLVFLHGLGTNHTVWKEEMRFLRRHGYSTIALDFRGHGKSDKPHEREKYTLDFFSRDIHAILKKEHIDTAVLLGHSMGGMIGLNFYKQYPKCVQSMVLLDTTYKISTRTLNPFLKAGFFLAGIATRFLSKKKIYPDFSQLKHYPDVYILHEINKTGDVIAGQHCIEELLHFDEENLLEKITVPTLVVGSTYDGFFRISVPKEMAKRIRLSELKILSGTHSIVIKKPQQISKAILTFLEKHHAT